MSRGPQLGEAGLCAVPDDVLSATVLARLECPRDVARLSSASKRFNALAVRAFAFPRPGSRNARGRAATLLKVSGTGGYARGGGEAGVQNA